MKEATKEFFKPNLYKIFTTLLFFSWQYFYSFKYIRLEALTTIGQYLTGGLSLITWNNYFIRTGSLLFIWIMMAFVIFILLWFFERIIVSTHNAKVMKEYVNRPRRDYEHLLREKRVRFSTHLLANAIWVGGIIFVTFSLFFLSDRLEQMRFSATDTIIWNAIESGTEINTDSIVLLAISFFCTLPLWYLIICITFWIFKEAKTEEEEEEIIEEHYALISEEDGKATIPEVKQMTPEKGKEPNKNIDIHRNLQEEVELKKQEPLKVVQKPDKEKSGTEKTVEEITVPYKTEKKLGFIEKIRLRSALGPKYKEKIITPESFKNVKRINPDEKVKIVSNHLEQLSQEDNHKEQ